MTGLSSTLTAPEATGTRPSAARMSVVLPEPFGAQHADEFAVLDREAGRREDVPAAEPDRHIVEAERGH